MGVLNRVCILFSARLAVMDGFGSSFRLASGLLQRGPPEDSTVWLFQELFLVIKYYQMTGPKSN